MDAHGFANDAQWPMCVSISSCVCVRSRGGGGWFWVKESTYMTGDINSWAALALAPVRSGTQI